MGTGDPAVEEIVRGEPATLVQVPAGVSPRLYNEDLAPTTRQGRTWHAYSIFTLWANDVHSLGNYVFAIGLFALGLGAWQIMLAFLLGAVLLFLLLNLLGFMGERTGAPFPVMSRPPYGLGDSGCPYAALERHRFRRQGSGFCEHRGRRRCGRDRRQRPLSVSACVRWPAAAAPPWFV
ncbi:putative allantoin permease [Arthrobacter sp. Hiyo4]|nr:putative allantoin permease [Arthrobacter sp. Hiyo4]